MSGSAILAGPARSRSVQCRFIWRSFTRTGIVVGVARGEITLAEFGGFVRDLAQAGVIHYRKIIDVTAAKSSTVGKNELLAADERLRELNRKGPRGPLALVTDANRGELAQVFKALAAEDRPVEVFRSIHAARKWLAQFPVTM